MKRINLDEEEFIEAWNTAESLPQFCEHYGYKYGTASSIASRLRSRGLPVKSFILPGHFERIGSAGGKKGRTGGFYANRQLARIAGAKGGRISRRAKNKLEWHHAYTKRHLHYIYEKLTKKRSHIVIRWPEPNWFSRTVRTAYDSILRRFNTSK